MPVTNVTKVQKPEPQTNSAKVIASSKPELPKPAPIAKVETQKREAPRPAAQPRPAPPVPASNIQTELVQLPAEPVIRPAQEPSLKSVPLPAEPARPNSAPPAPASNAAASKPEKKGFFQKVNPLNLFAGESSSQSPAGAQAGENNSSKGAITSASVQAVTAPSFPRYAYKPHSKPAAGNHAQAERAFAQALQAHQAHRLPEAIQAYRRAMQLDPAFFDPYYNLGLAAFEMSNLQLTFSAYEGALAITPDSLDARYNFALALKQGNYVLDAAAELEKVLRLYPNESRAHLVLGNIYAQQLRDPVQARQHYLKVIENDPRNPQASVIRYWLAENPR